MNNKLKLTLGTLPVLLTMVLTAAHASGTLGRAANDTLDFTLTAPSTAEIAVTPVPNLSSGKTLDDKARLATAVVHLGASAAGATDLGVKWVEEGGGVTVDPGHPEEYTLVSTSDKTQRLNVMLADKDGKPAVEKTSAAGTGYVGLVSAASADTMTLYVVVNGENETPSAGTYHGVLQAASYN